MLNIKEFFFHFYMVLYEEGVFKVGYYVSNCLEVVTVLMTGSFFIVNIGSVCLLGDLGIILYR